MWKFFNFSFLLSDWIRRWRFLLKNFLLREKRKEGRNCGACKWKDFLRLFLDVIRTAIDALKLPDGECLRARLLWLELHWVAKIFWDEINEASKITNRNLVFKSKHFSFKSSSSILKCPFLARSLLHKTSWKFAQKSLRLPKPQVFS